MSSIKNTTRSKFLRLESSLKTATSVSNSNFTVQLTTQQQVKKVNRIVLKSCMFQNRFYNVRTGIDDVLVFTENGQSQTTITVPQGFYSVSQIMTELATLFNAELVGATAVLTQGTYNGLITVTFSGNTVAMNNLHANATLAPNLGWITAGTDSASYTGTAMPDLGGLTDAYLVSYALAPSHGVEPTSNGLGKNRNLLGVIPITAGYKVNNVYISNDEAIDSINYVGDERDLSSIDIRLENAEGDVIDLQQTELKIIIKVYYDSVR